MSKALDAAKWSVCKIFSGGACSPECDSCKKDAADIVLAYLRALAEEGPSEAMLDAAAPKIYDIDVWPAMLRAHIAELEAGK